MRVILWTIAAIVSSIANGKFLLWQNDLYFAYRCFHFITMLLYPDSWHLYGCGLLYNNNVV